MKVNELKSLTNGLKKTRNLFSILFLRRKDLTVKNKNSESNGAKDVFFLTIFVKKKHPSHRPKPFPEYSDGMTTIYLTMCCYLSNFYFTK